MSNSIGPVDIEFALKEVNFQAEAARMKAEISGIQDNTKKAAQVMAQSFGDFSSLSAREMKESVAVQKQAIQELQLKIRELALEAKTASERGGQTAPIISQLKLAQEELISEQKTLLQMQKTANTSFATGTTQTNIYAKSMNNLGFSVQQVARELPSLAFGPQMFFLAISNNLPILSDNIKRVRLENEALKASGQATVPVWRQMLSSVLSWQTALVVGITLLTVYGKDIVSWVGNLFKGKDALEGLRKAQEEFNSATLDGMKNAQSQVTKLDLLYKAATDATKSQKERTDAVNELQKIYPKYLGNIDDEVIKTGNAVTAYQNLRKAIIDSAVAKAYSDKITEAQKKIIDLDAERAKKIAQFNEDIASTVKVGTKRGGADIRFGFGITKASFAQSDIANIDKQISDLQKQIEKYSGSINISDLVFVNDKNKEKVNTLEQQISEIESKMQTANGKELEALAKKLVMLQQELDLRKQIVNTAILKVSDPGTESVVQANQPIESKGPTPIQQKGVLGTNKQGYLVEITAVDKTGPVFEKVNAEFGKLNKLAKEKQQQAAKELEQLNSFSGQKLSDIYQQAFGEIEKYGANTLRKLKDQLNEVIDSAKQIEIDGKTMVQVSLPTGDIDEQGNKIMSVVNMTINEFNQLKSKTNQITNEIEKKNPFLALGDAWKNYNNARKNYNDALKTGDEKSIKQAKIALDAAGNEMLSVLSMVAEKIKQISDDLKEAADYLGGDFGNAIGKVADTLSAIMEFGKSPIKGIISLLKTWTSSNEISQSTIDQYKALISTIDQVINKQKELLQNLAGISAVDVAQETFDLINKQIDASRTLGKEYLASGSSWNSHSVGYKATEALKPYAGDFKKLGYDFSKYGAGGLFDLSSEQLQTIKEQLPEAWAKLDDQTREYLQNIIDGGNSLADMTDALNESLTNLSFDSAKSSLEELLLSADTTMSDVADNFEEYMRRAIVNMITDQNLLPALEKWYQHFSDAMADGILTDAEKKALQAEYENIYATGKSLTDSAYSAAGVSNSSTSSPTGATGIAASATADAVDAMTGQFMAMRVDIKELIRQETARNDDVSRSLIYMKQIADNTSYNKELIPISNKLDNIERVLKDRL